MKSSLSLLAALTLAFANFSAFAGPAVPFKAAFSTAFQSALAYPFVFVQVAGEGKASHLGQTAIESTDQVVDLENATVTATYYLTAANGDQLVVAVSLNALFVTGGLQFGGNWQAVGGTGRFLNATGSGTLEGAALFTGPDTGVDHFILTGSISSVGSAKH